MAKHETTAQSCSPRSWRASSAPTFRTFTTSSGEGVTSTERRASNRVSQNRRPTHIGEPSMTTGSLGSRARLPVGLASRSTRRAALVAALALVAAGCGNTSPPSPAAARATKALTSLPPTSAPHVGVVQLACAKPVFAKPVFANDGECSRNLVEGGPAPGLRPSARRAQGWDVPGSRLCG
jgi:hypothetical protein